MKKIRISVKKGAIVTIALEEYIKAAGLSASTECKNGLYYVTGRDGKGVVKLAFIPTPEHLEKVEKCVKSACLWFENHAADFVDTLEHAAEIPVDKKSGEKQKVASGKARPCENVAGRLIRGNVSSGKKLPRSRFQAPAGASDSVRVFDFGKHTHIVFDLKTGGVCVSNRHHTRRMYIPSELFTRLLSEHTQGYTTRRAENGALVRRKITDCGYILNELRRNRVKFVG